MTVVFLQYDQWQPGSYRLVIEELGECSGQVTDGVAAPFTCTNERVTFEQGVLTIFGQVDTMEMTTYRDGNETGLVAVNPAYKRPDPDCHPECRQSFDEIPA